MHTVCAFANDPEVRISESPQVSEQESEQESEQVIRILEFCKTPRKKQEILNHIGLSTVYMNYKRYIFPPVQKGLLSMTHPENPRHRNQRYVTTQSGLRLLKN